MQRANAELQKERPEDYRPLHLFPGVEINVHGGIHMLAVLDPAKGTSDIDQLLGAAGLPEECTVASVTRKSPVEVAQVIDDRGGLAIPAHIDSERGILVPLAGPSLREVLDCPSIIAAEALNKDCLRRFEPKPAWTAPRWPSCEVTRTSAIPTSMRFMSSSGSRSTTPGTRAGSARWRATSVRGCPAIVGGRGTGKSTIVEMLRLALDRRDDMPEEIRPDFASFASVPRRRDDAELLAAYGRYGSQLRAFEDRLREMTKAERGVRDLADNLGPSAPREEDFDASREAEADALDLLRKSTAGQRALQLRLDAIANEFADFQRKWSGQVDKSAWDRGRREIEKAYEALQERLQREGVEDVRDFGGLVDRRRVIEKRLAGLDKLEEPRATVGARALEALADIEAWRAELLDGQLELVTNVPEGNALLHIRIVSLVGHDDCAVHPSIRGDPTVGHRSELRYRLGAKLRLRSDPFHDFREPLHDLGRGGGHE